jgi:hypothetical protein
VLAGSDCPLVISSGVAILPQGRLSTEETVPPFIHHAARSRDPLQWKMVKAAQEQDKAITADVTGWTPGDPRKFATWQSS